MSVSLRGGSVAEIHLQLVKPETSFWFGQLRLSIWPPVTLGFLPQRKIKIRNKHTQEAEAGRYLCVPGRPGLYSEFSSSELYSETVSQ